MQDLIAKIEQLRKDLAAMKPKSAGYSLVPALKPPTLKPLSISSSTGTAPKPKLPGISQASTKDPKKMAEQLKNPRPKAPKIEVMKTDDEKLHRIHVKGHPVTEPMKLSDIVARHGSIKRIESDPDTKVIPVGAPKMPKMTKNGQWSLDKSWTDPEARAIRLKELEEANKKVQHTNTGQRGTKAYTSAVMGTAEEQAHREHEVQHGQSSTPKILSGKAKEKAISEFKSRAKDIKFAKNGQWSLEKFGENNSV